MAGPADEIIVRLTADASQLQGGLTSATESVQAAQEAMASSGQAAADVMTTAAGATSDAFDAMAAQIAASTQAAKAEIAAMVEAAGGGTAGLASSDAIAAEAQAFNAMVQARVQSYARLNAAMSAPITSSAALEEADSALTGAMETGAITTAEYTAYQVQLGAAEDALTAQTDANTGATLANNESKQAGSRVGMHYMGVFGLLSRAAQWATTSVGATTIAVGGFTVATLYGAAKAGDLNDALRSTGDYAGVTAADIEAMGARIAGTSMSVGTATSALAMLAETGRFTGDTLATAGQAAADMAQLTGESMDKAVASIVKLQEDPIKATLALNQALHGVTAAEFEQIQRLQDEGNMAGAAKVAIDSIAAAEAHRTAQMDQDEPAIIKWLESEKRGWENLGHAILNFGNAPADSSKLNDLTQHLNVFIAAHKEAFARSSDGTLSFQNKDHFFSGTTAGALEQQVAEWNKLHASVTAAQHAAADSSMHAKIVQDAAQASVALDALWHGYDKVADRALAAKKITAELAAEVRAGMPLPEGVNQIGNAFSGPGYDYLVNKAAGQQARNTHPYIAAGDSGWNVGALSPDDRAMMAVEERQIAARQKAQQIADEVQKTQIGSQASHSAALLDMQRSHVQALAGMGSISASSEIAQEQSLADQIYAIKLNEYQRELALANLKPTQQASINAEIIRAQDTLAQTTQTLADKSAADQVKTAESVVAPITQAFGGVVTGYIQGTLTMQQAEQRMGSAILAETVSRGVTILTHAAAIDLAKTGITAAGLQERLTLEAAAAMQSTLIHAEAAIKWIVTEAAKAEAAVFAAFASLGPWGVAAGVAAAVAVGAEVMHLVGNVASAEGGWERVPMDGMPTILHKDEQVLPAQYAEGLRNLVAGGGGGDHYHFHVNALDGPSMRDFIHRNPKMLADWAQHANRTGHFA